MARDKKPPRTWGVWAVILPAAALTSCGGPSGACGYCDVADDNCVALCERTCNTCQSVDPPHVDEVHCYDNKIQVHTDDGAIHVCYQAP